MKIRIVFDALGTAKQHTDRRVPGVLAGCWLRRVDTHPCIGTAQYQVGNPAENSKLKKRKCENTNSSLLNQRAPVGLHPAELSPQSEYTLPTTHLKRLSTPRSVLGIMTRCVSKYTGLESIRLVIKRRF